MESEDRNRTNSERFFCRFERRIPLERNIEECAVSSTFKNGVLTVKVPKNAKAIESSKRILSINREAALAPEQVCKAVTALQTFLARVDRCMPA